MNEKKKTMRIAIPRLKAEAHRVHCFRNWEQRFPDPYVLQVGSNTNPTLGLLLQEDEPSDGCLVLVQTPQGDEPLWFDRSVALEE